METFAILDRVILNNRNDVFVVTDIESSCGAQSHLSIANKEHHLNVTVEECTKVGSVRLPDDKYVFLKMYIVVDEEAPTGLGVNSAAHVAYKFARNKGDTYLQRVWEDYSFRKVTCSASKESISKAIEEAFKAGIEFEAFFEPDWDVVGTSRPISVAFAARYSFPEVFSTEFRLHSSN